MRERFWIVGGRNAVNEMLRNCLICKRQSARPGEQKMSDLPTEKVTPSIHPRLHMLEWTVSDHFM